MGNCQNIGQLLVKKTKVETFWQRIRFSTTNPKKLIENIFFQREDGKKSDQLQYIPSDDLAADLLTKPKTQVELEKDRCFLLGTDTSSNSGKD